MSILPGSSFCKYSCFSWLHRTKQLYFPTLHGLKHYRWEFIEPTYIGDGIRDSLIIYNNVEKQIAGTEAEDVGVVSRSSETDVLH